MRNVLLVIKHEIASMLSKRSFWIMTFLFPVLILGLNIGVQVMSRRAFENDPVASGDGVSNVVGYVDRGGLIAELPPSVPPDRFRAFPGEDPPLDLLRQILAQIGERS